MQNLTAPCVTELTICYACPCLKHWVHQSKGLSGTPGHHSLKALASLRGPAAQRPAAALWGLTVGVFPEQCVHDRGVQLHTGPLLHDESQGLKALQHSVNQFLEPGV